MEEIKVNDYVRTKKGEIHKVISIELKKDPEDWNYYKYENDMGDFEMFIAKHSSNIIDLVEMGDYVNREYVRATYLDGERKYIKLGTEINGKRIYEEDIKSIVTHESFNSIKYEVI